MSEKGEQDAQDSAAADALPQRQQADRTAESEEKRVEGGRPTTKTQNVAKLVRALADLARALNPVNALTKLVQAVGNILVKLTDSDSRVVRLVKVSASIGFLAIMVFLGIPAAKGTMRSMPELAGVGMVLIVFMSYVAAAIWVFIPVNRKGRSEVPGLSPNGFPSNDNVAKNG